MNNYIQFCIRFISCCFGLALFSGCSTQRDNAANRSLQNLSARYNLIYNSNVLLDAYEEELALTNKDNYADFLAIYIAPPNLVYGKSSTNAANAKMLDEISAKAQTIVAEKALSNYVDDAYLLLAKTNFYKGDFFTAAAYFDYTQKAYSSNINIRLKASTWKARSLMQLENFKQADALLDTVTKLLDSTKKEKADSYATLAQMDIQKKDITGAISHLQEAIKSSTHAQQKIRWSYVLAQLFEHQKQYPQSLEYYSKVEKSNAPFEMYFNAKLSKIRINGANNAQQIDRKQQLLKLLKDDKNLDYIDQIYYEVAEDYFAHQDFSKAEEYYKLAAKSSVNNINQKGLAYLKLADLNFRNLGNYVNAKLYYDSAASTLPQHFPGYESIVRKGENLSYLTQRFQLIAKQDSLQALAKLSPQDREQQIAQMFTKKTEVTLTNPQNDKRAPVDNDSKRSISGSTFYFNNVGAIAKGFTDFRKRWGNRPLADDWRQSAKSSAQANQQNQNTINTTGGIAVPNLQQAADKAIADQIAAYTALLPLTSERLAASDQEIIDAYFEIGNFYQQVLDDHVEAIKVYGTALKRYPRNNRLDAMYYSLYLAYAQSNNNQSDSYRRLILDKFPNSIYAKAILDPNYSAKQNAIDVSVNNNYNAIFTSYEKKNFNEVISSVNGALKQFPNNQLQPQYEYLRAIAIGKTQPLDSLLVAFNQILVRYPNDNIITPLVKDHLSYINANLNAFKARKIALVDFDPAEPRFIAQQDAPAQQQSSQKAEPVVLPTKTQTTSNPIPPIATSAAPNNKNNSQPSSPSVAKDQLFDKLEAKNYYFVISVSDVSVSVSSSRFGVGQFNRANFAGTGLKHQLYELDEDQLIFVGNFKTLEDVKAYSEAIIPQLSKIMKVSASSYKSFYISEDNFNKIKNRETLNRYLEFFKHNF